MTDNCSNYFLAFIDENDKFNYSIDCDHYCLSCVQGNKKNLRNLRFQKDRDINILCCKCLRELPRYDTQDRREIKKQNPLLKKQQHQQLIQLQQLQQLQYQPQITEKLEGNSTKVLTYYRNFEDEIFYCGKCIGDPEYSQIMVNFENTNYFLNVITGEFIIINMCYLCKNPLPLSVFSDK